MFQSNHLIGFGATAPAVPADLLPTFTASTTNGITITTYSEWSTNYGWKVADKNSSTGWQQYQAGGTGWVRFQFPSAKTVTQYAIQGSSTTGYCASAWDFQGSNDGSSWTTLDSRSSQSFGSSEKKTFTPTSTGSYTYYRVSVTTMETFDNLFISEVELTGY